MRRDRAAAKAAVKARESRDRAEIAALRSGLFDLRPATADTDPAIGVLAVLPLVALRPADDNLRRDLGDLAELAGSIASVGILQPLLVNDAGDGSWLIVAGHRRHAAAVVAGLSEVPCMVRSLDEVARLEAMIVENIQRAGLTPLEEADGYRRLVELTGLGQRALGVRVGRGQSHVSKRLALLGLPGAAQAALASGTITLEDAALLCGLLQHPDGIGRVLEQAASPNNYWTVRELVGRETETLEVEAEVAAVVAALPAGVRHERVTSVPWVGRVWRRLGREAEQVRMSEAKHRALPCHLVLIDGRGKPIPVCEAPRTHAEYAAPCCERDGGKPGPADTLKAEREEARRLDKAMTAAAAARLVHLQRIVTRDVTVDDLFYDAIDAWLVTSSGHALLLSAACDILGLERASNLPGDLLAALADPKACPRRARGLAAILAAGEWQVRLKIGWATPQVAALYRRLKADGYQPCPDEENMLKAGQGR